MQLEAVWGSLQAVSGALGRSLQVVEHRRTAPHNYLMPQSAAQGSSRHKFRCPSALFAFGVVHSGET
eukprot:6114166-Alexandrium_andersonii.AAC.1